MITLLYMANVYFAEEICMLKRQKIYVYIIPILFMVFGLSLCFPKTVRAGLYIDSNYNIHLDTGDKKRTSSIWYRTIGFTAVECGTPDNPSAKIDTTNQSPRLRFQGTSTSEDGYSQYNSFMKPWQEVTGSLGASVVIPGKSVTQRAQEAMDGTGPGMWLRMDCVMVIYHGSVMKNHLYDNVGNYNRNPAEIMAAEPWANPSGLKTHFKRYIYIGNKPEDPEPLKPEEEDGEKNWQIRDAKSENTRVAGHFKYATGNRCGEYDLNQGIPSGRGLTNDYLASEWYGETSVWARTKTTSKYMGKNSNIHSWYWATESQWNEEIGEYEDVKVKKEIVVTDSYDEVGGWHAIGDGGDEHMGVAVSFQYIADLGIYDFEGADIYNSAYGGTSYDSNVETQVEAIHYPKKVNNGEAEDADEAKGVDLAKYENYKDKWPLEDTDWDASSKKHINPANPGKDFFSWDELHNAKYCERVDLGPFEDYATALEEARILWRDYKRNARKNIKDGTTTRNDKLVINGQTLMLNEDVIGVHWIENPANIPDWTVCTECAGPSQFQYGGMGTTMMNIDVGIEQESHDVWIDETKPNGAYNTGIKATYARIGRKDYIPWPCFASSAIQKGEWFQGEVSSDTGAAPNSISDGHLTPSNQSNDGVIQVHTPIVAPITIGTMQIGKGKTSSTTTTTPTDKTQQCNQIAGITQLRLDDDYVVDWEEIGRVTDHRGIQNYGQNSEMKYDEFVENKYVTFPFDVWYNGVFYEAKEGWPSDHNPIEGEHGKWNITGPHTQWIEVEAPSSWDKACSVSYKADPSETKSTFKQIFSTNHWRKTPFYIPSFADEIFGESDYNSIYCRVEAYNVHDAFGTEHTQEQEHKYNKNYTYAYYDDGAKYVATYKVDIQLSGWAYDFTVTGTSDRNSFMSDVSIDKNIQNNKISFTQYKWDKKIGTQNRLGTEYLRFRRDGSTVAPYPAVNTLVLRKGKSNQWDQLGALPKGTEFSYSFKTIANLYHDDDKVKILPTFRYISADGKEYDMDKIKVYYNAKNENEGNKAGTKDVYVEYGSDKDKQNVALVKLADEEFNYSYYGGVTNENPANWRTLPLGGHTSYSAGKQGITVQEFMERTTPCYTLSTIELGSRLRMLSGEWEQLKTNTWTGEMRGTSGFATYGDFTHKEYKNDESDSGYDPVTHTMKHDYINSEFYKTGKIYEFMDSMQTWFGQYYVPSNLYIVTEDTVKQAGTDLEHFDLYDYILKKGGIKADDPIFVTDSGYLVINFKIVTYMNGKAHLAYYGGNGGENGWTKEGFDFTQDINDDGTPEELKSGDVVVVDLSKSLADMYSSGLFNIN